MWAHSTAGFAARCLHVVADALDRGLRLLAAQGVFEPHSDGYRHQLRTLVAAGNGGVGIIARLAAAQARSPSPRWTPTAP